MNTIQKQALPKNLPRKKQKKGPSGCVFLSLFLLSLGLSQSVPSLAASEKGKLLTLGEFLEQVEKESPDLQLQALESDQAEAASHGIRLPAPMVGWMQMSDGSGRNNGIEISQEIPFPGKLNQELDQRQWLSQAQKASSAYRKQEIRHQARWAYLQFWSAWEKNQILVEKRDWLRNHARISKAATRADSAAQIHLAGVESEVDRLENQVLESESALLEKSLALQIFAPHLKVSDLEPVEPRLQSPNGNSQQKSPLLTWKEAELQSALSLKDFKNESSWPDLFVRYRGYNGNDSTAPSREWMLGITLPFLYFWQPKAEKAEGQVQSTKAQAELTKSQIEIDLKTKLLLQRRTSLQKQLQTLQEKLLPRAHRRMKLVENLSTRTMEGLDEHRTVMIDYLDLREKAVDARLSLEVTESELQTLLGEGSTK